MRVDSITSESISLQDVPSLIPPPPEFLEGNVCLTSASGNLVRYLLPQNPFPPASIALFPRLRSEADHEISPSTIALRNDTFGWTERGLRGGSDQ